MIVRVSASAAHVVLSMVTSRGMGPDYGPIWNHQRMRTIPDSGFAGDTGEADEELAAALSVFDGSPTDPEAYRQVLGRLRGTRLLVPVVAILGEMEGNHEKTSDMAAVLMTGKDGRKALLAFTSGTALQTWAQSYVGGESRPVPVTAQHAAQAAIQDGAAALLIDVAGPVMFVVEGDELNRLALGG
jgi:hypothetical protein